MIYGILQVFFSSIFFVWGFNFSWAAHVQDKPRDMWLMHIYSLITVVCALILAMSAFQHWW